MGDTGELWTAIIALTVGLASVGGFLLKNDNKVRDGAGAARDLLGAQLRAEQKTLEGRLTNIQTSEERVRRQDIEQIQRSHADTQKDLKDLASEMRVGMNALSTSMRAMEQDMSRDFVSRAEVNMLKDQLGRIETKLDRLGGNPTGRHSS